MVTRKEDTPQRVANRKYEAKNKQKRQAASGNFQTMIPRDLFDEINAFLKDRNMSKVDFIKKAYEFMPSLVCSSRCIIDRAWVRAASSPTPSAGSRSISSWSWLRDHPHARELSTRCKVASRLM